ncbi:MAG TPA: PD-(D/E)XK nuclease family protein [Acidimicrobiales bacterium]|nr:PD-(D/E)XK nuclease family protein [Acidimicrobiales bacterium]
MPLDAPLPAHLSPTRLADFGACPRRYQHAAIDRIPQPATYATAKGRLVHLVLERLFALDAAARTLDAAREMVPAALADTLTDDVRADLAADESTEARLATEADQILSTYFSMEDPGGVHAEGVELRLTADVDGAPLLGILDRLDREASGELTIVDYKTGSVPRRDYDPTTFANTELYAMLCERALGERPSNVRLMYIARGATLERPVTDRVIRARSAAAALAWTRIGRYYEAGEFPATPSPSACKFCAYRQRCRDAGIKVPA